MEENLHGAFPSSKVKTVANENEMEGESKATHDDKVDNKEGQNLFELPLDNPNQNAKNWKYAKIFEQSHPSTQQHYIFEPKD